MAEERKSLLFQIDPEDADDLCPVCCDPIPHGQKYCSEGCENRMRDERDENRGGEED